LIWQSDKDIVFHLSSFCIAYGHASYGSKLTSQNNNKTKYECITFDFKEKYVFRF